MSGDLGRDKMVAKYGMEFGEWAGFGISLVQHGPDDFSVCYGAQYDGPGLTYARAAAKLGEAFMHALACEGKIDNRTKSEARQEKGKCLQR